MNVNRKCLGEIIFQSLFLAYTKKEKHAHAVNIKTVTLYGPSQLFLFKVCDTFDQTNTVALASSHLFT